MRCALLLTVMAAAPAAADTAFIISVSNRVTEVQPSATIELRAMFDEGLFAFAGTAFDFLAAPDGGGFSDPQRVLDDPGTQDGEVAQDGDSVNGVIAGQLYFPVIEWPIDTSNPVLVWRVTWSTSDFTPRSVGLATDTSKFDVYVDKDGTSMSFLDQLVEGSGAIQVGCYGDCTGDGTRDLFDFLCFVNQFNAGEPNADCDGSGGLDLFDFLCFVNAFNGGC